MAWHIVGTLPCTLYVEQMNELFSSLWTSQIFEPLHCLFSWICIFSKFQLSRMATEVPQSRNYIFSLHLLSLCKLSSPFQPLKSLSQLYVHYFHRRAPAPPSVPTATRFTQFFLNTSSWCPTRIATKPALLLSPLASILLYSIHLREMHKPPPCPGQKPIIQDSYPPGNIFACDLMESSEATLRKERGEGLETPFDSNFRYSH